MTLSILSDIATTLKENSGSIGTINAYAFGSLLKSDASPNDIDILVIYVHENQPRLVRAALKRISEDVPLHLIFMFPQEEVETNFVGLQKCQKFYPV